MSAELKRNLTDAALEIGRILNTVADDDVRDELHGVVERAINDELYAGSERRGDTTADVIELASRTGHGPGGVRCSVVDIFSRKVHP